jgi:L-seryl-tRNA(Ser) seleniumtransferase
VRDVLVELTGAEDALVVNNNAAATYLALNSLAAGREAVVSRGQLVEIGGSYRLPDIMAASGCRMVEVGTTNRTHLRDYERALGPETAVLLRVHTSNYRLAGFVHHVPLEQLVALARRSPFKPRVIDDLGSGVLFTDFAPPAPPESQDAGPRPPSAESGPRPPSAASGGGEAPFDPRGWDEPTVRQSVAAGADLTLFSGDKLLGGPQAGIVVGRCELIEIMRGNPLMRAFRPDKLTLAALEATLRLYRDPARLCHKLPVLNMLSRSADAIRATAQRLERACRELLPAASVECVAGTSLAGGGSLPTVAFPSWALRVRHPAVSSEKLAAALRRRDVPVIARLGDGALLLDCRTLSDDEADEAASALADVSRELCG